MNVILFGLGKMGKFHYNVLKKKRVVKNIYIVDPFFPQKKYKNSNVCKSLDDVQGWKELDFAVVATPAATLVDVALSLLRAGIPTLIEKPVALSKSEIEKLLPYENIISVGYIERHNPVVLKLKELFSAGKSQSFGTCLFTRFSEAPPRITDVGVDLDFAVHDLDLAHFLFEDFDVVKKIKHFDETGLANRVEYGGNSKNMNMSVDSKASWLQPESQRKIYVSYDSKKYVADLGKMKITNELTGQVLHQWNPEKTDKLSLQLQSFISFVSGKGNNLCSLRDAIKVLNVV